jgi:glucose-1-phosphate thymidylyltransferase
MYKGILLAGGSGSRLAPTTWAISKQLMPIYDKPMVYYPLCTLMEAGIREILVITTPKDQPAFSSLLRDGSQWGLSLTYAVQERPEGIAQALLIGQRFLAGKPVALILGDNLFYGDAMAASLGAATKRTQGATVFGYQVADPQRYGVLALDEQGHIADIVEKPREPPSNYAVTGLYFYDHQAPSLARELKPSARGELEITDLNQAYLRAGQLFLERLGRGVAWLDAGTHNALLDAALFIRVVEERQGLKIACPEETAYRQGFIDKLQLAEQAHALRNSSYGRYLAGLLES